jgi:hypothetical protein
LRRIGAYVVRLRQRRIDQRRVRPSQLRVRPAFESGLFSGDCCRDPGHADPAATEPGLRLLHGALRDLLDRRGREQP